nr:16S rRNA (guanine(527)-N(7))-methyltransferase RsmG [Propionibacterium sp.]
MAEAPPAPPFAADAFGAALPLAERYAAILVSRGVEWGLLGPREAERVWGRHVLNSLAVADDVPAGASVVDVGSGAGLPGIPLALARPDLRVTLLEPLERRAAFLQSAVAELGLENRVRVVRGRAENHLEHYDAVVCRAVAPLSRLLGWTSPLFLPGGRLVALKGASAAADLKRAAADLRRLQARGRVREIRLPPDAEPTYVVVVTPAR